MKVAIYCRVSTHQQNTDNQQVILENHAINMKWDYTIFNEVESTRKTRPIKYKLFQRLRMKEFDAVCVLKLDRWGRSMSELVIELAELYKNGIKFISLQDNIDLSTASGKFQFHMLSAFAEFERGLISERTREGLARKKAQDHTLGRPKGSKDTRKRNKEGYILRAARDRIRKHDEGVNEL